MHGIILSCVYDGAYERFLILLEYELDSSVSRLVAIAGFCGDGGELTVT